MQKYKTALIILLVFLCVFAVSQCYAIINNLYQIIFVVTNMALPQDMLTQQIVLCAVSIVISVVFLGGAIFGIVVLSKILRDRQLYARTEQKADGNPTENSL